MRARASVVLARGGMIRLGMKPLLFVTTMAVIACSAVSAQQVTEFKQPGDFIRLEIKFDGPDTAKIKSLALYFGSTGGRIPENQEGFKNFMNSQQFQPVSPGRFLAEIKIPEDVATGDYTLIVNVQTETNGTVPYPDGQRFHLHPFHVRNPKTFIPPSISVTVIDGTH
jgi:hypothetical protein